MEKFIIIVMILFCFITSSNANKVLIISAPKGAKIQGISEEVLKEAYNKIGYDIKVEYIPNTRSLIMANSGNYDAEMSRVEGIDNKFKNMLRIPVPINYLEAYAFSKKNININDWKDLNKYSLGCVRGVKFIEQKLRNEKIDCSYVTFYSQIIKMLRFDRIEIAVIPRINGMNQIKEEKAKDIHLIEPALEKANLYHYLNKKHSEIAPKLKDVLLEMEKSGRIKEIREKFLLKNNL